MTSKSITARENRRRQKRREIRERGKRNDVRKVHRYGFVRVTNMLGDKADGPRNIYDAACGKTISDLRRRHVGVPYAVPDDSFIKLPRAFQCEACLATHWPGNWPPRIQRSGVRTHRMALEMLFDSMQRMWQARLEVGHRCYVALFMHENGVSASYRRCSCGRFSYCDEATRSHTMAVLAGKREPLIVHAPTLIAMLAARSRASDEPCPCAPGGGDGPHAEWCDGGK